MSCIFDLICFNLIEATTQIELVGRMGQATIAYVGLLFYTLNITLFFGMIWAMIVFLGF